MNNYTEKDKKFLKKLGENLKKFRLQNDLSQEKLAFKAGLDRTYISGIERGERNISIITIQKIAEALKVDMLEIFKNNSK